MWSKVSEKIHYLYTQNKKRAILSLKKEPMLHILNNQLESQIIGPCRRVIRKG